MVVVEVGGPDSTRQLGQPVCLGLDSPEHFLDSHIFRQNPILHDIHDTVHVNGEVPLSLLHPLERDFVDILELSLHARKRFFVDRFQEIAHVID